MADAADVVAVFPGAVDETPGEVPAVLAELAAAARLLVDHIEATDPERLSRAGWARLQGAVEAAERSLAAPGRLAPLSPAPALRRGAGATERAGARRALPRAGSEARFVLDRIMAAGAAGATLDEVHAAMEAERGSAPAVNQLQARRWDLERSGWVEAKQWCGPGEALVDHNGAEVAARPTRSGAQAIVWVATPAARNTPLP